MSDSMDRRILETYMELAELETHERLAEIKRIREQEPEFFAVLEPGLNSQEDETTQSGSPVETILHKIDYQLDDMVGRVVGNYLIVKPLGHGGMGDVYLGEHQNGGNPRKVAIKFILPERRPEAGEDNDFVHLFRQEKRILEGLNHPLIPPLVDSGLTEDGLHFIIVHYHQGQAISDHCKEYNLGRRARLNMIIQICRAVQSAHGVGIMHMDIKPDNILVTSDNTPLLLDFGIAVKLDDLSPQPRGFMTPAYAAPERFEHDWQPGHANTACDIYSLGVLLYRLFCGQLPFTRKDRPMDEFVEEVKHADPPPSKLPFELKAIILHCLKKKPEDRYTTVKELETDLENYLGDKPVTPLIHHRWYNSFCTIRKHRWTIAIATIMMLFAVWQFYIVPRNDRISREFIRTAEQLENRVKEIKQSRPHDIRPYLDKQWIVVRETEEKRRDAPFMAQSAAKISLGRMYLALGDFDNAIRYLKPMGSDREVAYFLGLAFAYRYNHDARIAELAPRKDKENIMASLDHDLDVALDTLDRYLEQPLTNEPTTFVRALQFYLQFIASKDMGQWPEDLFQNVLREIDHALENREEVVRGSQLKGWLYEFKGDYLRNSKESGARAAFEEAARIYRIAGKDRSYPELYRALAVIRLKMMEPALGWGPVASFYEEASENLDLAWKVDSRLCCILLTDYTLLHERMYKAQRTEDPARAEQFLTKAEEHALEAMECVWGDIESIRGAVPYNRLGSVKLDQGKGRDPEKIRSAITAFKKSIKIRPSYTAKNKLGMCYLWLSRLDVEPLENAQIAASIFQELINENYAFSGVYANFVNAQNLIAYYSPENKEDAYRKAVNIGKKCPQKIIELVFGLALAHLGLAEIELENNGPSDKNHLGRAKGYFLRFREKYPDNPYVHTGLARVYLWDDEISRAMESLDKAFEKNGDADAWTLSTAVYIYCTAENLPRAEHFLVKLEQVDPRNAELPKLRNFLQQCSPVPQPIKSK